MPKRQTKNQKAYQKEIQRLEKYAQELSKKTGKIFIVPTMYSEIPSRVTKKRLKDISSIDKNLFSKIATRVIKKTGEIKEKSKRQIGGYKSARTRESRGYKPNVTNLVKNVRSEYNDLYYNAVEISEETEHQIKDAIDLIVKHPERREFLLNHLLGQEIRIGKFQYYSFIVFFGNLEEMAIQADSSQPFEAYNGMSRILDVIYLGNVPEDVLVLADFLVWSSKIEDRRKNGASKAKSRWANFDFS